MKPKVFIALASGILGGPGKGLAQFLRSGGLESCEPLLANYNTDREHPETEYVRAMRATGANLAMLYQTGTYDYSLVKQAMTLVREHGSEILQSHGYKSHVLCYLLRCRTGLPWIAFVHGWTDENFKVRLYNAIDRFMPRWADMVIAVSESVRARLRPAVQRKCRVIPNALDPVELQNETPLVNIREQLGIPAEALVAGVVGRLSPEKGQQVFIQALAQARQHNQRLCGLLVGEGQEREHLHSMIRALGLGEACFFTGHVQGLAKYYRAMNMQIMPSFTEGMPNAALEGMYMGLPLLASSVGGIPEVVVEGETGLLLPAGNAELLAKAMLNLAEHVERGKSMGIAGRVRVQREFDPQVRAKRIAAVYTELLTERLKRERAR